MSVEWGKPKAAQDGKAQAKPAQTRTWEELAATFPSWSLDPPAVVALRKPKPTS